MITLFFFLLKPEAGQGQLKDGYEEVSISLNVQRIGIIDILAIIHGQEVYLPVKELFDFLKIKNNASPDYDTISGFFIHPKAIFVIDKATNQVVYQDQLFKVEPDDLIQTETDVYLKSVHFDHIFGLACVFQFRSLSMTLTTKLELPAIREMQQEQMRLNISQLKGEKKADTTIKRSFSLFHLGMADWSVMSNHAPKGQNTTRINLGLGAIVLGGEANAYLNYNSDQPFSGKQQFYRWRYVNNDNPTLRQFTAGKLFTQSTSSIYDPIIGLHITNTPTTYRRSFGTYTMSNNTEPGWMVELYVNNVLVDYTKADASGFFTFQVPIVYGNSLVKLRYYGPWGEERVKEQNVSIPFNFIPLHQLEYSVTAGFVKDEYKSRFARASVSYGLSRNITIGGGTEYLSSVESGKHMPFVNASVRLGSGLLLSGEHTYGVRSKGVLTYRRPSNLQVDLLYVKYDKNQMAVRYNYLEEQKAIISMPFRGRKFTAFSRLTLNRYRLPKLRQTTGELLVSGVYAGVSSNVTTFAIFTDLKNPLVFSNVSMSFRLPAGIRLTPQAQYEYRQHNFSTLRGEAEKAIFKNGYLNIFYEEDMINEASYAGMGLRYNFSFAQTFFAVRQSAKSTEMTQSARGSLMYNDITKNLKANNQPNVGRGGLVILPFLDLNCNGVRESNEPKAPGLKFHVNGGQIERNDRDTTFQVNNLESYVSYLIELNKNSFDNIAWQLKNQSISVAVEPNYFKQIEVPVAVVGEVSGTVLLRAKSLTGLGRMIIKIYNSDAVLVSRVISESDGYFSYLGLAPGNYTARIDQAQLLKLHMVAAEVNASFTITPGREGDVVDGLRFIVYTEEVTEN
ncbi:MAG: hypothetical protein WKF97_16105 [Chitinophagaceae bacterium]